MESVFIKSSLLEQVLAQYRSGLVIGPLHVKQRCGFQHTLDNLLCRPKKPNPLIQSFAMLAIAAYIADKGYARTDSEDSWTRELFLSIPIDKEFVGALPLLTETLRFLSGDSWSIVPRVKRVNIAARTYFTDKFIADAVCLFSGGTDSLTGAINLLEDGGSIILVSHFESGVDAGVQNHLANLLKKRYGSKRLRHRSIKVSSPLSEEKSTRARSFLFIALALMTASAFNDKTPVFIPENGFIGMNVPLTGSRQGSFSTRTTHPAYLFNINKALHALSLRHEIINPFYKLSKGEILQACKNPELLKKLLPLTLSCAKAGWVRWERHTPGKNCGFCFPCLVRRSAFHAIGVDNPNDYAHDAIGSAEILSSDQKGSDLRCLLQATSRYVRSNRSLIFDLLKTGSLSSIEEPADLIHPIESGLKDILTLVAAKGCAEIKRYAFK